MKSYYIDCRELTEEQVGEVCNELERLGYKRNFMSAFFINCISTDVVFEKRLFGLINKSAKVYNAFNTYFSIEFDQTQITLEELKAL